MKLINYKRGFIDFFDCSIHGRIVVSNDEWQKIRRYAIAYALDRNDFDRFLSVRGGRWYCIRVTATEKVVKHFKINNYKRGNYVIEVKN